jgi:bacillopeptidase F
MKTKKHILLIAIVVSLGLVISNTSSIGDSLKKKDEEVVSVLVYLKDHVDLETINDQMDRQRASLKDRHEKVVKSLQTTASESQPKLIEYLTELQNQELVIEFECFWVGNIIRVETYQNVADQIAKRDDVYNVYPNYEIELIAPVEERIESEPSFRTEIEPGIEAIRADEVWDMGITGDGVLVATLDTGVDGDHPALASRWAGVADPRYEGHPEWAWFDPYAGQNDFPYDSGSHGTHTMGTVCGGSPGDQIGVAPGALWISAAPIDRGGGISRTISDAIKSFEWLIDPDGNPETNWDVPAVCSNSWRITTWHGYPPCDDLFWSYLDACEAAGTVIIFSAGNEGYYGLGRPPDRATDDYRCFAVAAVDANEPEWPIADWSSRGPTYCTPNGDEAIKPDISAPGVYVRSALPGGGYGEKSGTSMASPHVNGVVALMREANPNLGVEEIKEIIFQTAYDLGDPGEDNDYGWGMIDAYEAVFNFSSPPDPPVIDGPISGKPDTSYTYKFTSTDLDGDQVSYYIDWDDGNITDWTDFQTSGEPYSDCHTWSTKGTYTISAKAKDESGFESDWGTLTVSMPKDKISINSLYIRLLEKLPLLQKLIQLGFGL